MAKNIKMNCQLYTAESICDELFLEIENKEEVRFDQLGSLCRGHGSASVMYTITELASKLNMPLWEIVMIDNHGFDDYAVLFYEHA